MVTFAIAGDRDELPREGRNCQDEPTTKPVDAEKDAITAGGSQEAKSEQEVGGSLTITAPSIFSDSNYERFPTLKPSPGQKEATTAPPALKNCQGDQDELPGEGCDLPDWVLEDLSTQLTEDDLPPDVKQVSATITQTLVQEKVGRESVRNNTSQGGGGAEYDVVQECKYDLDKLFCNIHDKKLMSVKTKKRAWVLCKNGLYRTVYKNEMTWKCPGDVQKSTTRKTLVPGGTEIKSSPRKTQIVRTLSKKRKDKKT